MDPDLDSDNWRKSSYSNTNGGDCVEVSLSEQVGAVRDSKARSAGILKFSPGRFAAFVKDVRDRRFDG